jgi:hypothetical protein
MYVRCLAFPAARFWAFTEFSSNANALSVGVMSQGRRLLSASLYLATVYLDIPENVKFLTLHIVV